MSRARERQTRYVPCNLGSLSVTNPLLQANNRISAGQYSNILVGLDRRRKKSIQSLVSQERKVKEEVKAIEREKFRIIRKTNSLEKPSETKNVPKPFRYLTSGRVSVEPCYCLNKNLDIESLDPCESDDESTDIDGGDFSKKQLSSECYQRRADLEDESRSLDSDISDEFIQYDCDDSTRADDDSRPEENSSHVERNPIEAENVMRVTQRRPKSCKPRPSMNNIRDDITTAVQRIIAAKDRMVLRKMQKETYLSELKKLTNSRDKRGIIDKHTQSCDQLKKSRSQKSTERAASSLGFRSENKSTIRGRYDITPKKRNDACSEWYDLCNRIRIESCGSIHTSPGLMDSDSSVRKGPGNGALDDQQSNDKLLAPNPSQVTHPEKSEITIEPIETEPEPMSTHDGTWSDVESSLLRLYHRAHETGKDNETRKVINYFKDGWLAAPSHTRALAKFLQKTDLYPYPEEDLAYLSHITSKWIRRYENIIAERGPGNLDLSPLEAARLWDVEGDKLFFRNILLRLSDTGRQCGVEFEPLAMLHCRYPQLTSACGDDQLKVMCSSVGIPPGHVIAQSVFESNGEVSKSMSSYTNTATSRTNATSLQSSMTVHAAPSGRVSFNSLPPEYYYIKGGSDRIAPKFCQGKSFESGSYSVSSSTAFRRSIEKQISILRKGDRAKKGVVSPVTRESSSGLGRSSSFKQNSAADSDTSADVNGFSDNNCDNQTSSTSQFSMSVRYV